MKWQTVLKFVVYGNPKAQKRHRHTNRGGFVQTYDPSKGCKEDFIAQILDKRPDVPLEGPLCLKIEFCFPRPKAHFGTRKGVKYVKNSAPVFHTSRPDLDNLEKFVKDAGNKILWRDDSVISQIIKRKTYSDIPRTEVEVLESK